MGPLQLVVVQPTPFCNIDCRYCYLGDRANRAKMKPETFRRFAHLLFASRLSHDGFRLVWHGGEPLSAGVELLEGQVEILRDENRHKVPVHFEVQTNATLIDSQWIDFFRRYNVRVGVSLDGPEELNDAHRRTRSGRGTFGIACRGVDRLREAGITFDLICVLTKDSLSAGEPILRALTALGGRSIGFNVEEIEGANRNSSLDWDGLDSAMSCFWHDVLAAGAKLDRLVPIRELDAAVQRLAYGIRADDDQRTALRIVSCDWQGRLSTFSPELIGTASLLFDDFVFGNVETTERIEDLAAHPAAKRMMQSIRAGDEECRRTCSYFSVCGGGVPSNKFFEHKTLQAAETVFCRAAIKAPVRAVVGWSHAVNGSRKESSE